MVRKARVALLTNFLPIYRVPLLEHLSTHLSGLRIFLSVRMEKNRNWPVSWGGLDVQVSRSLTITRNRRSSHGYTDTNYLHIPYDTLLSLWRYRPEVVISGELGARTIMARVYKVIRPRTKLIIWATLSEHTEAGRSFARRLLRRWLLRGANAVYVNGASGARYIRSMGFSGPLTNVPYTADNQVFANPSHRVRSEILRLLYTGQLVERKGLSPFLAALAQWCHAHPQRSVFLSVVGSGDQFDRIRKMELPSNLQVEFKGSAQLNDLPRHYHAADLYVYPTLADEWGLVVNEALSAGLPVLGSRYSQAVEELVQEGVTGWLFTPTDPADTYAAIDRALSAGESLDVMSSHAIAAVKELTQQQVAARMGQTVREVCNA
jgi:glycosyltransferase involved in cell wall biosynthesis